jgi:hypothetical protein
VSNLRKVPGKPGYEYGTTNGITGVFRWASSGRGEDKTSELKPVLPWAPQVIRYIVSKDSKGKLLDARYTLVIDGHEDTIAAEELGAAESWSRWPGAVGVHDRAVREVLAIVVQDQAVRQEQTVAIPYWSGDQLIMPSSDLLARGYGEEYDSGDRDELIGIAAANPKLALIIGFSYGAPYVEPLSRQPFWVCPSGDSSKGKTTALLAAACLHGRPDPRGVKRPRDRPCACPQKCLY